LPSNPFVINFYKVGSYTICITVILMAKPIRATPVLKGEEALKFIEKMHKTEKSPLNQADRAVLNRLVAKRPYFDSLFENL